MDWKNEIYKYKKCFYYFNKFKITIRFNTIFKNNKNHVGTDYKIEILLNTYDLDDYLEQEDQWIYYEWESKIYNDKCLIYKFKTKDELINDIIKKHNLYIFFREGDTMCNFIKNYCATLQTNEGDNEWDTIFYRAKYFRDEIKEYINEFVNNFIYKSKNIHLRINRTFNKFICNKIWNHYNNNFARSDIYELIIYEKLYPYVGYNYKNKHYLFI